MKPEKLKDLLFRSLSSDLGDDDREVLEKELLIDHKFSEGFRDRVMRGITSGRMLLNGKREMLRSFDSIFMKVAIPGAAAIVVLVLSLLFSQGSLSYDTLLGIDSKVDGVLVSLMSE